MNSFYLRDSRSNTGSSCMFWAENGNGYTTNLDRAHVTRWKKRSATSTTAIPICRSAKRWSMSSSPCGWDHQYLDESQGGFGADGGEYVIHVSPRRLRWQRRLLEGRARLHGEPFRRHGADQG